MTDRDLAAVLRLRAAALRDAARVTYEVGERELMWKMASVLTESAEEIEYLRQRIARLESNSPQI